MITGTKEYLDDVAKHYVCSDHLTPVVVAWHAQENSYVLRCGEGHYPEEVTRQLSLSELHRAGELPPGPIQDNIIRREKQKAMESKKTLSDPNLALVPKTDLGTGELLNLDDLRALVAYASTYSLDPKRGHVVLMYGKPYITIDGYLYHANKSGTPYTLNSRPFTDSERAASLISEGDHAWSCELTRLDTGATFPGTGIVTKEEMTAKSPRDTNKLRSPVVAAHPWQLAQKRAEWQTLRRAFPIGETEEVSSEA